MVSKMSNETEIYRAEVNSVPILRVVTDLPVGVPLPVIEPLWLRCMLARAIRRFFRHEAV